MNNKIKCGFYFIYLLAQQHLALFRQVAFAKGTQSQQQRQDKVRFSVIHQLWEQIQTLVYIKLLQFMGPIHSPHLHNPIFPQHTAQINQTDFTPTPNYSYTQHTDPYYSSNYTVLTHRQRPHLQLQKYQLFFNTYQQYQTYEEVYNWRNKSRYLVQARAIRQKPANRLCGTFHQATLYLQRIPIRACQITDIPIQQSLYMLYTSILGFRKIYQRTGYFDISLDMICINKDALIKVWMNGNLSKIYPQLYSINQNLTQTDFIYKLISLCEPLIDFQSSAIDEKFSDFLKCCYFESDETPRNEQSGKFCSYSKIRQSSSQVQIITASKKLSSQQNVILSTSHQHTLTFDKLIEYFQAYLGKHNLVIARQMKSIRDVFKFQQKIYFHNNNHDDRPLSTKQLKQSRQTTQKLQPLRFINNDQTIIINQQNAQNTRRKNSKWTGYYRKKIERVNTENNEGDDGGGMMTHKSEEFVRRVSQCNNKKEIEVFTKRPPSVSFGYHPLVSNRNQQLFSPQHIATRQRIRTTIGPSVSFTICANQTNHIKTNIYSPNKSYMPSQRFFYKNKTKSEFIPSVVNDDAVNNGVLLVESRVRGEEGKGQGSNRERKRTIWYTVEEERYLDEDIANDMELLEKTEKS